MEPAVLAVTFDHWDTLVHESATGLRAVRSQTWASELAQVGHDADPVVIEAALEAGFLAFQSAWGQGRQFHAADAVDVSLGHLGLADRVDQAVRNRLTDLIHTIEGRDLPLVDGAAEVLAELKGKGLKLGIICDVGLTPSTQLRANLDAHGVLGLFDHWSFSDDVGAYKPDAAIFEHAARGLGVASGPQIAHVGDLRRTDVAGAQAAGWVGVRFTGMTDDPEVDGAPEGDVVIGHLSELPSALGL